MSIGSIDIHVRFPPNMVLSGSLCEKYYIRAFSGDSQGLGLWSQVSGPEIGDPAPETESARPWYSGSNSLRDRLPSRPLA